MRHRREFRDIQRQKGIQKYIETQNGIQRYIETYRHIDTHRHTDNKANIGSSLQSLIKERSNNMRCSKFQPLMVQAFCKLYFLFYIYFLLYPQIQKGRELDPNINGVVSILKNIFTYVAFTTMQTTSTVAVVFFLQLGQYFCPLMGGL